MLLCMKRLVDCRDSSKGPGPGPCFGYEWLGKPPTVLGIVRFLGFRACGVLFSRRSLHGNSSASASASRPVSESLLALPTSTLCLAWAKRRLRVVKPGRFVALERGCKHILTSRVNYDQSEIARCRVTIFFQATATATGRATIHNSVSRA